MTIEQFLNQLTEEVRKSYPDSMYEVNCDAFRKNNDTLRHGIFVKGKGEMVSPTIYVDRYYSEFLRKKYTIPEIANEIVNTLEKARNRAMEYSKFSIEFDNCKDRIVFFLVSKSKNSELLKEVPFVPFLDFAITFHVVCNVENHGIESLRINNQLMEKWGITTSDLYRLAEENSPRMFPAEICSLSELLFGMITDEIEGIESENDITPMLILTNSAGVNGASAILYPNLIQKLAMDLEANLYIIPSSIHEILIIPAEEEEGLDSLSSMVEHINANDVSPEEVLSDRAYYYDRFEKKFVF